MAISPHKAASSLAVEDKNAEVPSFLNIRYDYLVSVLDPATYKERTMRLKKRSAVIVLILSGAFGVQTTEVSPSGAMQFATPLMSATGVNRSHTVTLGYSSTARKNTSPSWVGANFNLDMPYIERSVVGGPDDCEGTAYTDYDSGGQDVDSLKSKLSNGVDNPKLFFNYYTYKPLVYGKQVFTRTHQDSAWVKGTTGVGNSHDTASTYCHDCGSVDYIYKNYGNDYCWFEDTSEAYECSDVENSSQQDIYSLYNFPAGGGRLFFMNDEVAGTDSLPVAVTPYRPWRVQYAFEDVDSSVIPAAITEGPSLSYTAKAPRLNSWTIVDENGTTYIFDKLVMSESRGTDFEKAVITYEVEEDTSGPWDEPVQSYASLEKAQGETVKRWYLSKIVGYDGEEITIEYNEFGPVQINKAPHFANINKYRRERPALLKVDVEYHPVEGACFSPQAWMKITMDHDPDPNYPIPNENVIYFPFELEYGYNTYMLHDSIALPPVIPHPHPYLDTIHDFHDLYYVWMYFAEQNSGTHDCDCHLNTFDNVAHLNGVNQDGRIGNGQTYSIARDVVVGFDDFTRELDKVIGKPTSCYGFPEQCPDYILLNSSRRDEYLNAGPYPGGTQGVADTVGGQFCFTRGFTRENDWRGTGPLQANANYDWWAQYDPPYNPNVPRKMPLWSIEATLIDESEKLSTSLTPARIITEHHILEFTEDTAARTAANQLGRGKLLDLRLKDRETGLEIERVEFVYDTQASELRLSEIIRKRSVFPDGTTPPGGTKRVYSFGYQDSAIGPSVVERFGSKNVGLMNRITNVTGGETIYEYEYGSAEYTTAGNLDLDTAAVPCGIRVKTVTRRGGAGTPDVVQMYSYGDGELPYSHALELKPDTSDMYGGLEATLVDLDCDSYWENQAARGNLPVYAFMLRGGVPLYHSVGVGSVQNGFTYYDYTNAGDGAQYTDNPDEYHIARYLRGRLKKVEQLDACWVNQRTCIEYEYQVTAIDGMRFSKGQTFLQEFELVDVGGSYFAQFPDHWYGLEGRTGLGRAPVVQAYRIDLVKTTETLDKVTSETTFQYNDEGMVVRTDAELPGKGALITEYDYAYDSPDSTYFRQKNLLTSVLRKEIHDVTSGEPSDNTVVRCSMTRWAPFPQASNLWYPSEDFAWKVDLDNNGQPVAQYVADDLIGAPDSTGGWISTGSITRRSALGHAVETVVPNNLGCGLASSTVLRKDGSLVVAQVSNAYFDECGAYTCDYVENCSGTCPSYLDWPNAWEKGQGNGSGLSNPLVEIVNLGTAKHFGVRALKVKHAWGPSRNFVIHKTMDGSIPDYVLSAWIRPEGVPLQKGMVMDADYRRILNPGGWPVDLATSGTVSATGTLSVTDHGQWKHVELSIPASSDLADSTWGNGWGIRVWVGAPNGPENAYVYIEDIRFGPADALMETVYYNGPDEAYRPRMTVDAKSLPSPVVEYDAYGREQVARKFTHDGTRLPLARIEYTSAGDMQ